jgi:hypothetical protein
MGHNDSFFQTFDEPLIMNLLMEKAEYYLTLKKNLDQGSRKKG